MFHLTVLPNDHGEATQEQITEALDIASAHVGNGMTSANNERVGDTLVSFWDSPDEI
jgi:hypothetical protein